VEISNKKPIPQPDAGVFLGTIIDVVDMPNYPTAFGPKNKVRIVWVLGKTDSTPALDVEGKPFQVISMPNASMNEKSTLFKLLSQILGQAPPLITTSEQLSQLLLGRSNQLFLTKTPNPQKPGEFFTNVTGVMPLTPGQIAPQSPQGFLRSKDKFKTQAGPNGQPVQTYAQPPQQQAPTQPQQPAPFGQTAPQTQQPAPFGQPPQNRNVSF
jgi:hypothetical protein